MTLIDGEEDGYFYIFFVKHWFHTVSNSHTMVLFLNHLLKIYILT